MHDAIQRQLKQANKGPTRHLDLVHVLRGIRKPGQQGRQLPVPQRRVVRQRLHAITSPVPELRECSYRISLAILFNRLLNVRILSDRRHLKIHGLTETEDGVRRGIGFLHDPGQCDGRAEQIQRVPNLAAVMAHLQHDVVTEFLQNQPGEHRQVLRCGLLQEITGE